MKLGILTSFNSSYLKYQVACEEMGIDYEIVDILASDWVERVQSSGCDGFLARPPCDFQERKTIYDERLYFLTKELGRFVYPSFDELYIYENKRAMAHWLQIHGFPHPRTNVFCRKKDALAFLKDCALPVVFKANIGASSSQVRIVRSNNQAKKIVRSIFGLVHPALSLGYIGYRFKGIPIPLTAKTQRHYVIIQDYHPIRWEWRVIKIGPSYFGFKKLLKGTYASGSRRFGWEPPPTELLDLLSEVCDRGKFLSMAMDVFETEDGRFLINELQSIFGSNNESQMYIDGVPGRYTRQDGEYVFEEGVFNTHKSYPLRVAHLVDILQEGRTSKR